MSKFHALTVSNIDKETDDCVSLTFAVPDDLKDMFKYTQGQHVSVRADIGGEDIRRSYSICSSVAEDKLRVAVRAVEGGRMSGFINKSTFLELIDPFPLFRKETRAFCISNGVVNIDGFMTNIIIARQQ